MKTLPDGREMFPGWSDGRLMMNGITPDHCTCHLMCGVRYEDGLAISPAEYEQADDCPIHPL